MTLQTGAVLVSAQIGASDCEAIGQGVLAQPSNAISSIAYVVVGGWLVERAIRDRSPDLVIRIALGATVAAIGAGSIAFHGPMPGGARLVHDVTIIAALALIGAVGLGRIGGWRAATALWLAAVVTAALGAVLVVAPDAGVGAIGLVASLVVVIELAGARAGPPRRPSSRTAWWLGAIVSLLAVGAVINALGRTGGLLCDPHSLYQPHALWHVLTAAALGTYGHGVFSGAEGVSVRPGYHS